MERRGWILALGAVALIGVGLYVWWSDSSEASHARAEDSGEVGGVASHAGGGGGSAPTTDEHGRPVASTRRAHGDAGVEATHVGPRTDYPEPGSVQPSGIPSSRGIPRSAGDENQTAGWRLGQARVRMEILQQRIDQYEANRDRLAAEGNAESAARQQATIDRVSGRLEDMRELEAELVAEAEADGTMGDVDTGYENGEPTHVREVREGLQGTVTPR